jgi:hypothetical protein
MRCGFSLKGDSIGLVAGDAASWNPASLGLSNGEEEIEKALRIEEA